MGKYTFFVIALLTETAWAGIYWQPAIESAHQHGGRADKSYTLVNVNNELESSVVFIHSDLTRQPLVLQPNAVKIPRTGKGNYHALLARQHGEKLEKIAVRYLYMNGRPVDTSPSDLLAEPLSRLQLLPAPLPREHWRYESRKSYVFRLLFDGQPLVEQPVLVSTSFGSSQVLHSDEKGYVELMIPEDFAKIIPQKRATAPGELRLFTSFSDRDMRFETSLSTAYQVGPSSWKNTVLGMIVIVFGVVAGLLLNRRIPAHHRRKRK